MRSRIVIPRMGFAELRARRPARNLSRVWALETIRWQRVTEPRCHRKDGLLSGIQNPHHGVAGAICLGHETRNVAISVHGQRLRADEALR